MSALRRTIPMIGSSCRLLGSRSFHTASRSGAKQSSRAAPSVTRKSRQVQGAQHMKAEKDIEESLPPVSLLQAASKSAALDVHPEKALEILRDYQELAKKSSPGWEAKLCTDHDISPGTLELLAKILNRCPALAQRHLARKVMLSASGLGQKSATFNLIEVAIRSRSLNVHTFASPLQQLDHLAKQQGDPQAMALLGKVLLSQAREKEAFEWFRKATRSGHDFEGAGAALVHEGQILLNRKDTEGAKAAFRKAALELDDPSGYFYLSQLEEPGSEQQEVYLLKAASSGIVEAWHKLGALELSRIYQRGEKPTSIQDFGMAREWCQIAAAGGFGLSMLNIASICKVGGQSDAGLKWLEMTERLPEIKEQAKRVRDTWESEEIIIS